MPSNVHHILTKEIKYDVKKANNSRKQKQRILYIITYAKDRITKETVNILFHRGITVSPPLNKACIKCQSLINSFSQ